MKLFSYAMFTLAMFVGSLQLSATCTVTTPCGTYTYDTNSASVSSVASGGVTTITVRSNGQVVDEITCNATGGVSTVCNSGGGGGAFEDDGDDDPFFEEEEDDNGFEFEMPSFCDFFTNPWIRAWFGCD